MDALKKDGDGRAKNGRKIPGIDVIGLIGTTQAGKEGEIVGFLINRQDVPENVFQASSPRNRGVKRSKILTLARCSFRKFDPRFVKKIDIAGRFNWQEGQLTSAINSSARAVARN